jgi:hypothetical protein
MFEELFLDHPRSVGEGYFEHQRRAFGFAGALLAAGVACLVHGLLPRLFVTSASDTVLRLGETLAARRRAS